MAFDLVKEVNNLFNGELVAQFASLFSEQEDNVRRSFLAIVPTILVGVLSQAGKGTSESNISLLLGLSTKLQESGMFKNLNILMRNYDGTVPVSLKGVTKVTFGDRMDDIIKKIAEYSSISITSAEKLVKLAAPAALTVIGKHSIERGLNGGRLLTMLISQKTRIISAIPSGLELAGSLGLNNLHEINTSLYTAIRQISKPQRENINRYLPFFIILLGLVLVWLLTKKVVK